MTLRPGDVLLVLAGPAFRPRALDRRDFLVVAALDGEGPPREDKAPLVGLIIVALLVAAGTGLLDILPAAFLAAFAVVALRIMSPTEARDSVDLDVIVIIAASFGLGAAIESSGLATDLSTTLVEPFGHFGDLGLLFGVLLATMVLTELITNNAAAILLFPVALSTAPRPGSIRGRSPSRSRSAPRRRSSRRSATRRTRWSTASAATASATTRASGCRSRS